MNKITIWHNPRCSKSREAKAILDDTKHEVEVVEYLKDTFSCDELIHIMELLGVTDIRDMLRKKESEYTEFDLANSGLTQNEIINMVIANPKLLERPIIIKGDRAVIARPMENLTDLLK
ncbi:MAG: arsenate reductase (glutaredoxin) [Helicobacteraceae bacterium]|nr:arsenate reductase (glutaredoxin) [Helicobacteraceae bacterium]